MENTDRLEGLLRQETPQVLGALVRRFGRFDIAEDATQEAMLVASRRWPVEGIPSEPRSWLIRVGYRRMVDLLRSEQAARRRERDLSEADPATRSPADRAAVTDQDDSLILLLLCCHPALSEGSQIALTLRAVGGLTTAEIAHAYGATESTMASRISRAKQTLKQQGVRFEPPTASDQLARSEAVMKVLYLIFNEGYTATEGDELDRTDLTDEAIRLARLMRRTIPDDHEVAGLLSLMLLTDSRRATRSDSAGALVLLEDQDRSLWNRGQIDEGVALIEEAWHARRVGPYQLQAAIAAVHAQAQSASETDWAQIAALYLGLERLNPTGPVRLSRVVAIARAFGPLRGLALLDDLERTHHLSADPLVRQRERSVRAHLLDEIGDAAGARAAYLAAAALTDNVIERDYLRKRADQDRI